MQPSIDIRNVSKSYGGGTAPGGLLALDNVSLQVGQGEFLAILGPSGCGKSTLLHVVAGLTPARGELLVQGKKVTGPGLDRGVVFQDYALFPWRTVLDNVAFGLEMKKVPRHMRAAWAYKYVTLVGLEGFEDRYTAQLSGGMKQRVAIARALAFDPEVLLMDEPFAALDAQTREILQTELLRIWEQTGKTILFVTHSIDEAIYLAQRVVVMTARPGRIKQIVDIDLPWPRVDSDMRSSRPFALLRHRIWELLAGEVEKAQHLAFPGDPFPGRGQGGMAADAVAQEVV